MMVVGLFVCSFGLFGLLSYYTVSSVSSSLLLHPPPARGASIFEALSQHAPSLLQEVFL
jgi:hypothetical protein